MKKEEQQVMRFKSLEHDCFQSLEHSGFLKGLLKPFKGKRELDLWASQCEQMRDDLIKLGDEQILNQCKVYPFALLPVKMVCFPGREGMQWFRWRMTDSSRMGETLWDEFINSPSTPAHLVNDLLDMEKQRITLNMQISQLHNMARQARIAAAKMTHAETVVKTRTNR
ncbi:MAG: DUF3158 family protein [Saezia sp.]